MLNNIEYILLDKLSTGNIVSTDKITYYSKWGILKKMNKTNVKLLIIAGIIFSILLFSVSYVLFRQDIPNSGNGSGLNPENAFTFFGVGPNTEINRSLRDELRNTLGSDAIETRTIINFEILYPGFIQQHFPLVYQLNKKLNENPRQRIEHNTIKITFRYIPDKIQSFNYVELLFSNHSRKPLYCKIRAKNDGIEILELLKTRYGQPEKIDWGTPQQWSFFWKSHGDILIFSNKPDKFGNPEYFIMTYYVSNIEDLIEKEKQEERLQEEEAKKQ
jgi:hypothetical protein